MRVWGGAALRPLGRRWASRFVLVCECFLWALADVGGQARGVLDVGGGTLGSRYGGLACAVGDASCGSLLLRFWEVSGLCTRLGFWDFHSSGLFLLPGYVLQEQKGTARVPAPVQSPAQTHHDRHLWLQAARERFMKAVQNATHAFAETHRGLCHNLSGTNNQHALLRGQASSLAWRKYPPHGSHETSPAARACRPVLEPRVAGCRWSLLCHGNRDLSQPLRTLIITEQLHRVERHIHVVGHQ